MDSGRELGGPVREVVDRERLHGEGEVHDLDRVTVGRGDVHERALREKVDPPAVGEHVLGDVAARLALFDRELRKRGHVDLVGVVARVGEERPIFHDLEVLPPEDPDRAGAGQEDVAD